MRAEHEIWCSGSGACSLCWTEVQSPLWVQLLLLTVDYKTFLDRSFPRHCTDIGQILFLPRSFPRGTVSGAVSKCVGGVHTWRWPAVRVHAFMTPVILAFGPGLGVCKKAVILRKTWKIFLIIVDTSSAQLLDICCFSRCYFYEISQGCECTLLEIPTTSPPFCFCRSRYAVWATSFFIISWMISLVYLRTRHKTVKNIHLDIIVPSSPPPKVLIRIMGLSLCKLSSVSLNKSVSGGYCKWTFCILDIVACNWEISKDRLWWTYPLRCSDNWSQVYALWLYL